MINRIPATKYSVTYLSITDTMLPMATAPRKLVQAMVLGFPYRALSTGKLPIPMCGFQELPEYGDMASIDKVKETSRPLDTVSRYILHSNISVNRAILMMDVHTYDYRHLQKPIKEQLAAMRKTGELKIGRFTVEHDEILCDSYKELVRQTGVDDESLRTELFRNMNSPREFTLQRNLVGFFLLQNLSDGDQRLPVDVVTRLPAIFYGGQFSKEEDAAILAWVEEHGPCNWTKLAVSLGMIYIYAGDTVHKHYKALLHKQDSDREGPYSDRRLVSDQQAAAAEQEKVGEGEDDRVRLSEGDGGEGGVADRG